MSRGLVTTAPLMRPPGRNERRRLRAARPASHQAGFVGLCLLLLLQAVPARADFSDYPVTLIVPFAAGGFTDTMARALAPVIARYLGPTTTIDVVNRPNGSGEFAYAAIAKAEPDGYTFGLINAPPVLAIPIERVARYTVDSLDPLLMVAEDPGAWSVRADSPYKTVADFIAAAKANPGRVLIGTTGVGTDDHLGVLHMERLTGVKLSPLHFPSTAAARAAMLDGRIAAVAHNLADAVQIREHDPVRVLGIMSRARWLIAPDIPTFREQGYEMELVSLRGFAAPKGLPPETRGRLVRALWAAMHDPDFRDSVEEPANFQPLRILETDDFTRELRRMQVDLVQLWREHPWGAR